MPVVQNTHLVYQQKLHINDYYVIYNHFFPNCIYEKKF